MDTSIAKTPPKVGAKFYSSQPWRDLRAQLVAQRGRRCEHPRHIGDRDLTGREIYGDHIRELKDGGAELDPANVMLCCASCHTLKTNIERDERMKR